MQKIKTFFVVLLLVLSFNTTFASTVQNKVSDLASQGYTVIAVLTGNYWMINAYGSDRTIREIVEEF